jgi:hypothetical protein
VIPARAATAVLVACVALAASGCKSTAPYTMASAGINTALAAGVAVAQKKAGGCYAQCTGGLVCNENTGLCEKGGIVCIGSEADSPACIGRSQGAMLQASRPGSSVNPGTDSPVGISPATGSVPPPPSSASPTPAVTRP